MTIIRCTRSPSVNPYVVVAIQKVKGSPRQKEQRALSHNRICAGQANNSVWHEYSKLVI
jgi:hypothetical protein